MIERNIAKIRVTAIRHTIFTFLGSSLTVIELIITLMVMMKSEVQSFILIFEVYV